MSGKDQLEHAFEIVTMSIPWMALPFRLANFVANPAFLRTHVYMLSACAFFSWMRFMKLACSFSKRLGPMVILIFQANGRYDRYDGFDRYDRYDRYGLTRHEPDYSRPRA